MKKRTTKLAAMLLAVIMLLSALPVSAANSEISPFRYDNVYRILVSLNISDKGLSNCYGKITLHAGASVDMSLILQKSTDQVNWSDEKTWVADGSYVVTIDKDYYVVSGYYYRVKLSGTVYDSSGAYSETALAYSSVKYY
mgnify:CR=1 FL=1